MKHNRNKSQPLPFWKLAIIGLSFLALLATSFWVGFLVGSQPDVMLNPWFLRYAIM